MPITACAAGALSLIHISKAVLGGIVLAVCGMALPYTMCAGEAQTHLLMDSYLAIGASALIATGLIKAALTPFCIPVSYTHLVAVLVVGVVSAFIMSIISIKFLMGYIKKNDFTALDVYKRQSRGRPAPSRRWWTWCAAHSTTGRFGSSSCWACPAPCRRPNRPCRRLAGPCR